MLYHDNTLHHPPRLAVEFLGQTDIKIIGYTFYLPDHTSVLYNFHMGLVLIPMVKFLR